MKRILLLMIFVFCLMSLSVAEDFLNYTGNHALSMPKVGDYVVYRNTVEEQEKIYTIICIEEWTYYVKVNNLETGQIGEFNIMMTLKDGELQIGNLVLVSGDLGSSDMKHAQIDFINIFTNRSIQDVSLFPNTIVVEQPVQGFKYSFINTYKYWVPVFNFYGRNIIQDPTKGLKLIRFGTLSQVNRDEVLAFTGLDASEDTSPSFKLERKRSKAVTFDGMGIPLDENWTTAEDNMAIFNLGETTYAYIQILSFAKEELDIDAHVYFTQTMMNTTEYIPPVTVETGSFKAFPYVKYVEYDKAAKQKSQIIIMYFDRGEGISVLIFSASKNFYDENKAYFNDILF